MTGSSIQHTAKKVDAYSLSVNSSWRTPLLSVACGALCLLIVFRPFFKSHFDLTLSDPVDGRFCVAILEHWYRVLHGKNPLTSPPFFFPERDVLGYSDSFFLFVPSYSLARFLGFDCYLALQLTMMFLTGVGFMAMLYLLRVVLGFARSTALIGASLFVTFNMYYIHLVHPHLASVVFLPVLFILAAKYRQIVQSGSTMARLYACLFGFMLAFLLLTSFYIGWFTIFAGLTGIALFLVSDVVAERSVRPIVRAFNALFASRLDVALACVSFAIGLIPFVIIYLPALRHTGIRPLNYTLYFMPPAIGVFDVGKYNLLWGRVAGRIEDIISPGGIRDHPTGWPVITICFFVATTVWCAQRVRRSREDKASERLLLYVFMLAVAFTCLTLWFVGIRLGKQATLWWFLWRFVPGASAIRIPPRVNLVINVGLVIVCMFGLEELRRIMARSAARHVVLVLLSAGLLVEQLNLMPTHLVRRSVEAAKFSKIPVPPSACSEFYVASWTPSRQNLLEFQVDAMLAAEKFGIPTLNGYSSWFPKDWDLLSGTQRRILEDAKDWARRHGIMVGVCSLDIASGTWSPSDVHSSVADLGRHLENAIANSGFENNDLHPWTPFQLTARLASERAHSGIHSMAEQSGEGGVYQDVRNLRPGQSYTVSAWVWASPGSTASAQIAIFDPGFNVAIFSSMRNPSGRWELLTESATVSHAGTLRVHLFRKQGSGTLYWDDVNIYLDQ